MRFVSSFFSFLRASPMALFGLCMVAMSAMSGAVFAGEGGGGPAALTLGTNPVDMQGTATALWTFVAVPLGVLIALSLAIALVIGLVRKIKTLVRGA